MKSTLHAFGGAVALLCISAFWLSTVTSELFLDQASVVVVKNAVLAGMCLLIPAMVATACSGFSLSRERQGRGGRLVDAKGRRMKIVAVNGLVVLLPSAFVLASWSNAGRFDGMFYTLQATELLAGGANLQLLMLNMRDGFKLTGRLTRTRPAPRPSD